MILNMPLRDGAVDFVAWHFDPRGQHTVRNAYKLYAELELQRSGNDAGSSVQRPEVFGGAGSKKWWRIWKLKCPNKIKHFWWRCAHNSIATRDNLIRRGVNIENPKCLFCNLMHEDGCHLFVNCKEVKILWRSLGYESVRMKLESCRNIECTMDVIWGLPEEQKIQIITMWWLWWQQRNKVREGEIPAQIMDLVHRVKCTAAEYLTCFRKETGGVRSSNEKWRAPSQGIIKFNTDGAFVEGNLFGGWGVIARSEDGEVVAARAGKSDDIHDAFTAEL
jgi:hypothetical protein